MLNLLNLDRPYGDRRQGLHLLGDDTHRTSMEGHDPLQPHLLYVGGEDHHLRIPAMCALRDHGFRITAAGTGAPAPFLQAGIDYRGFHFNRFVSPLTDWAAGAEPFEDPGRGAARSRAKLRHQTIRVPSFGRAKHSRRIGHSYDQWPGFLSIHRVPPWR